MKNLYKLLLVVLTTSNYQLSTTNCFAQAPDYLWAKSAGGTSNDYGSSIATDASGNVLVTGYFYSPTITFGTTTLTSAGSDDIFIVKYDASGNVLWAKSAGGTSNDYGYGIAADANGNVLVTGYFASATITFGTTTLTNAGSGDIFIVKYDASGNVLWAKSAGGTGDDEGISIAKDASGNVLVTGYFNSSTITFGSTTLNNAGGGFTDMFLVKYDANGNVILAKSAGGSDSNDYAKSVATDANGNILIAGNFGSSTVIFGSTTLTNSGNYDIFLAKYDATGNVLWAKSAGGTNEDEAYSVSTDASNNVYVAGYFYSATLTFGPTTLTNAGSGADIFLSKYDASGNVVWAKSAGGNNDDNAYSVSPADSGSVYVAGFFRGAAISFGSTTLTNAGSSTDDMFLAKYDANGNVLWAKSAGGTSNDYANSISADANGNILASGYFSSSTITFGTTTLTNAGSTDIFIAKLGTPPLSVTTTQTNVTCNGGSNGSATANANGGATPYTYVWSNGATVPQVTNVPAGTYTVTVTDASSATATASATITQPTAITVSISKTDATCNGMCNGTGTANVSGGSGGMNFIWSNGGTSVSANSLCAGNASVTVTDANGCTATASAIINQPAAINITISKTNACQGNCDGSATASTSGGNSPYNYQWNTGATSTGIGGLCAGMYTVTATDASGCTSTQSVAVTNFPSLSMNSSAQNVSCSGMCDGAITVNASGSSPFSYHWSTGQTSGNPALLGLCPGQYGVTVTDVNNCSTEQPNISISEPQQLNANVNPVNATCFNNCNGKASSNPSGGTSPYVYQWSNGSTADNAQGLCPGGNSYGVTVTDAHNCTASFNFGIGAPQQMNLMVNPTDAACNGCSNGMATVNVSGGISPYIFSWSNGSTYGPTTSPNTTGALAAGPYSVTVTDSSGCSVSQNFFINQPMNANINFYNDTNGGCAPFTVHFFNQSDSVPAYQWHINGSNVDTFITVFTKATLTYTFTEAGSFNVELCGYDTSMTMQLGCNGKNINVKGLSLGLSADSACKGDFVYFVVENNNGGGGGNNNYTWNYGDGTTLTTGNSTVSHSYSSNGTYTVTLIGNGGCGTDTVSKTLVIGNNITLSAFFNFDTQPTCPNDNKWFSADWPAAGTFTWNFGDGSPNLIGTSPYADHRFPAAGTYLVSLTVTNACGNSATHTDSVSIQNNVPFSQNSYFGSGNISPNPVCPGDAVNFDWSGSSDNYTSYIWNFGDGSTDTNDVSKIMHSYADTGTYIVSYTIVNGCGYDTVIYPPAVSVKNNVPLNKGDYDFLAVPLNPCPGDTVLFIAQNGAQAYHWHFGNGDSASATIIPGADFNGTQYVYSDTGTYLPTLTITNGCGNSRTDTMPLPVVVGNNAVPYIGPFGDAFGIASSDNNGSWPACSPLNFIILTGGNSFHWNWGDGTTLTSNSVFASHQYNIAGNYTITLTATNGCGNSATFTNVYNISGACPSPSVTVTGNNPTCSNSNNGSAIANASGGTSPYSYLWSNGKTTSINANLLAGTYSVTVTDVNGMTATASVTLTAPAAINLTMNSSAASCGMANGLASVTASGGATPYTYLWSNGQTSSIASNLSAGLYSVTVTTANGCKATGSASVGTSTGFAATFTATNISCNGANNGSAAIAASNGTPPYNYSWSGGQTTSSLNNLAPGTYNATVTDNSGCAITGSVQISQPPVLALVLNGTNVSSCNGNDGAVNLTVFGGTSPYTYLWNTGVQTQNIASLTPGTYTVTVTDAKGCTKNKNILITAPSAATLSVTKTNASCNGSCNGTATASASGGATPYTYHWNDPAATATATATGLCAGTYSVTVVESVGCATSGSVTITEPSALTVSVSSTNAVCGVSNGTAVANGNGGVSPYNYQWSNGDKTKIVDSLAAGIYLATVTDANGCSNFSSATVSNVGAPNITIVSITNVHCNGGSNGDINIAVTGTGTPYTYEWSNGAVTQDISNLSAGPYQVTVSNANGCVSLQSINISQPNVLTLSVSHNDATCGNADGNATVSANGGTTPYSYQWSTGVQTQNIASLGNGIYSVSVTDTNGCTQTASAAIGEVGGPTVTLDSIVAAHCAGSGSVYVSVADGVPPYTYSWNNLSTNEDLIGVLAGNYGLLVTDANGCSGAISAAILAQSPVTDPICLITVDTTTGTNKLVWQKTFGLGIAAYKIYKETTQAGVYQLAGTRPYDSLSVFVDSVANPLIHSWRYKLSAVDSCGNESPMGAAHKTMHVNVNLGLSNTINLIWDQYEGFTFPTYYIYRYKPLTGWMLLDSLQSNLTSYTDANPPSFFGLRYFVAAHHPSGCFATKSSENHNSSRSNKTYPLAPTPTNVTASASETDATQGNCDGTATATASGGVTPYSYLWSNGDTTAAINGLCAGTYTCTVTDSEGDTTVVSANVGTTGIRGTDGFNLSTKVYPNPNKGIFTVEINSSVKMENVKIKILNMLGEEVQTLNNLPMNAGSNKLQLDLSGHAQGVYSLQVIYNNGTTNTLRLLVH